MTTETAAKVKHFFANYPFKKFDKGEVIVHAGDNPAGVFYIDEGRVVQYDISPSGSMIVVNVFKNPSYFPMSWAMNGTPNHYFFEASTEVTLRQAPAPDVVKFVKENPEILYDLLSRVYRGTDGMMRRMAHMMGGDAKTRLQFELLNAAERFGEPRDGGTVFVALKESDLARYSGLARETVNRNLQGLKASGLIEITHLGFLLKDVRRLKAELGDSL